MKWFSDKWKHNPLLPVKYRRYPLLAGVAAGLWVLVFFYLARMIINLIQGDRQVAAFSILWSGVCFILWTILHKWAQQRSS